MKKEKEKDDSLDNLADDDDVRWVVPSEKPTRTPAPVIISFSGDDGTVDGSGRGSGGGRGGGSGVSDFLTTREREKAFRPPRKGSR